MHSPSPSGGLHGRGTRRLPRPKGAIHWTTRCCSIFTSFNHPLMPSTVVRPRRNMLTFFPSCDGKIPSTVDCGHFRSKIWTPLQRVLIFLTLRQAWKFNTITPPKVRLDCGSILSSLILIPVIGLIATRPQEGNSLGIRLGSHGLCKPLRYGQIVYVWGWDIDLTRRKKKTTHLFIHDTWTASIGDLGTYPMNSHKKISAIFGFSATAYG